MRIIGGIKKGAHINSPKGDKTRPTSEKMREAVFNIVQHHIEDALFLDLFSGSGAMGLEALSRGAKKATFVDYDFHCIRCIRENLMATGLMDHADLIKQDVFRAVPHFSEPFDLIYIDPPYEKNKITTHQCRDLLQTIKAKNLLKRDGILFLEYSHPIIELASWECRSRQFGSSCLNQLSYLSHNASQ